MSRRELRSLLAGQGDRVKTSGTRSGKLIKSMSEGLASRLAVAEDELTAANKSLADKNKQLEELSQLLEVTKTRNQRHQATISKLEESIEGSRVQHELEMLKASECLRSDKEFAIQQERARADEWIRALREGHTREKQLWEEKLADLERVKAAPCVGRGQRQELSVAVRQEVRVRLEMGVKQKVPVGQKQMGSHLWTRKQLRRR